MTVKFVKSTGKVVTFHLCESVHDAQTRFQWRYGYWPGEPLEVTP